MHARHKSPGNGYWSSSMSMGLNASRISPETSGRGHGFFTSKYRNFKCGFGHGQSHPKLFQPHPPKPRKGTNIFMEADRLVVEYLVSLGLLPRSMVPPKWQNYSLKKQLSDYQDYRSQEGDILHLSPDSQSLALARLGNATIDLGFGRRRYLDDHNSRGSRNLSKGRKKERSYQSYSSDWGREYGRSRSWSDRIGASPNSETDDDSVSGHHEETQVGKDVGNGLQKPVS